jgi:hypothetical protein
MKTRIGKLPGETGVRELTRRNARRHYNLTRRAAEELLIQRRVKKARLKRLALFSNTVNALNSSLLRAG